jgi:hypothetical protein
MAEGRERTSPGSQRTVLESALPSVPLDLLASRVSGGQPSLGLRRPGHCRGGRTPTSSRGEFGAIAVPRLLRSLSRWRDVGEVLRPRPRSRFSFARGEPPEGPGHPADKRQFSRHPPVVRSRHPRTARCCPWRRKRSRCHPGPPLGPSPRRCALRPTAQQQGVDIVDAERGVRAPRCGPDGVRPPLRDTSRVRTARAVRTRSIDDRYCSRTAARDPSVARIATWML